MDQKTIGLPAGFRDILFEEAKKRRTCETTLAHLFGEAGFQEILPSTIEFNELYARGHQGVRGSTFRFLDREDNLLALRADFTPAIARIVAGHHTGARDVQRVWYAGNVFRKVDAHQGLFSEFGQIGAELIGVSAPDGDSTVIDLALRALDRLGINEVHLHINHAGIFRGLIHSLEMDRKALRSVKAEIGRKDSRGLARRLVGLGVSREIQEQLNLLSGLVGNADVLRQAESALRNDESRKAVDELAALASRLSRWQSVITFDLAEIDEMEYYTGSMFSIVSPKLKNELGKGGRYDALLGAFGSDLPAVGFSFVTERLIQLV